MSKSRPLPVSTLIRLGFLTWSRPRSSAGARSWFLSCWVSTWGQVWRCPLKCLLAVTYLIFSRCPAFAARATGRVPTHVLPQPAPSPATGMLGPCTHKRYPELKQNTYSGYAERHAHTHTHTHTHTHGCREGLGSGTGQQKIPGDTRACVLRGWQGSCTRHTPPCPKPPQNSSLASVREQALNFKRCPPLSPNQAGAFGWPDLCEYQGLLAQLPGRTGRPRRAA